MIMYSDVLFCSQPKDILSERREETRNCSHVSKWNQRNLIKPHVSFVQNSWQLI